jgi:hypothetical protein
MAESHIHSFLFSFIGPGQQLEGIKGVFRMKNRLPVKPLTCVSMILRPLDVHFLFLCHQNVGPRWKDHQFYELVDVVSGNFD